MFLKGVEAAHDRQGMHNISRAVMCPGQRYSPHNMGPFRAILSLLPYLHVFFHKNEVRSIPVGRDLLCHPPANYSARKRAPQKAAKHRMTCKKIQKQECHQLKDVLRTKLVPPAPTIILAMFSAGTHLESKNPAGLRESLGSQLQKKFLKPQIVQRRELWCSQTLLCNRGAMGLAP